MKPREEQTKSTRMWSVGTFDQILDNSSNDDLKPRRASVPAISIDELAFEVGTNRCHKGEVFRL
jgi:hypothetical protein